MRWVTAGHTVWGSSGEKPTGSSEEAGESVSFSCLSYLACKHHLKQRFLLAANAGQQFVTAVSVRTLGQLPSDVITTGGAVVNQR